LAPAPSFPNAVGEFREEDVYHSFNSVPGTAVPFCCHLLEYLEEQKRDDLGNENTYHYNLLECI
jgi:hypothetical protein